MARERVISGESQGRDQDTQAVSLRPQRLCEMVGQRSVLEKLEIAMDAAQKRKEPLEHLLLDGPPGLGKTTLANVIANEMTGRPPKVTSGPALAKQADLMSMLTGMERGEILFIDEIHRLPRVVEEFLYPAMEDYRVDFTIEGGIGGRTVNFALQQFTLIGATTRAGMLSGPMRDRFGHQLHMEFYGQEELAEIIGRSADLLGMTYSPGAIDAISCRSRGTPRVANRLLRRVRDFVQVKGDGTLTVDGVSRALEIQQVDALGLDELDRSYLRALIDVYQGGPAGIEAIAATLSEDRDTLEDVVEPYLLQIGFVTRTRQGRQCTRKAYEHLNVPYIHADDSSGGGEGHLF